MRDPQRISMICNNLAELWSLVPDWRFGQLIENFKIHENIPDLFFIEDEDLIKRLKHFFYQTEEK